MQPGLADHGACRHCAFPWGGKKRNHRTNPLILQMQTRGPEFRPHVQGPKASQWPAQDHIMVSQLTQFSVIATAITMAKFSFCSLEGYKKVGSLGIPADFSNLCYPGLRDPGCGCFLWFPSCGNLYPKAVSFELAQSCYQGWGSALARSSGPLGL